MDAHTLFELGGLVIAAISLIGILISKNQKTLIKINENATKIVMLEADLVKMKAEHERDLLALHAVLKDMVSKIESNNREDHNKLFDRLGDISVGVAELRTELKTHITNESIKKSF